MIEDIGVPKNEVAKWVGITSAASASCQAAMAVTWGTVSDTVGRKPIILCGLTFTMIFSLMFGLSKTLAMLVASRALLGLMNGNVGIIRTMVAEMVPEKELQPRAFSIMPLVWTIGSIFGPAFGGALARPAEKHPGTFGNWKLFKAYPFLLPNLASAFLFVIGITTGWLFLHVSAISSYRKLVSVRANGGQETLAAKKHHRDVGLRLGQMLTGSCSSRRKEMSYSETQEDNERTALLGQHQSTKSTAAKRPSWKEVFSPQSTLVLLAYAMMAMHNMAFDSLLPVFLHTPLQRLDGNPEVRLPFKFIGGFGVGRSLSLPFSSLCRDNFCIDSQTIGIYYTLIGIIGMFVQFFIFPVAAKGFGVLNCIKVIAVASPVVYLLTPFTALVPASIRSFVVFMLMLSKLICSIFSFPCCTILLTNSAASLSVLGTLNGVGTSVSAIGRAAGPALIGAAFSYGVNQGYVILPWWLLAFFAALSAVPVFWVEETDGFQGGQESESDAAED
jgi:MFS family permease